MRESSFFKNNIAVRFFKWYFTNPFASTWMLLLAVVLMLMVNTVIFLVPSLRIEWALTMHDCMRNFYVNLVFIGYFAIGVPVSMILFFCRKQGKSGLIVLGLHIPAAGICFFGIILMLIIMRATFFLDYEKNTPSGSVETPKVAQLDERWKLHLVETKREIDLPNGRKISESEKFITGELANVLEDSKVMNAFAFDSLRAFGKRRQKENLIFSPVGQYGILGLLYLGCDGNTKSELAHVLHWKRDDAAMADLLNRYYGQTNSMKSSESGFQTNAGMWTFRNMTMTPEYSKLIMSTGIDFTVLDPEVGAKGLRKTINSWAASVTKNRINSLINSVSADECIVPAAISCFSGRWQSPFESRNTERENFTDFDGNDFSILMMKEGRSFVVAEDETVQWLFLPYQQYYAMEILLPKEKTLSAFVKLESKLSEEYLASFRKKAKASSVDLWLPRFQIHNESKMNDIFRDLGMVSIFNFETAQFTGIQGKNIFLSESCRNESIYVYEGGTEAISAAYNIMSLSLNMNTVPVFHIDHPFIYLIREMETGRILYLGRFGEQSTFR